MPQVVIYKPHCQNGVRNGVFIHATAVMDPITAMGVAHTVGHCYPKQEVHEQLNQQSKSQVIFDKKCPP